MDKDQELIEGFNAGYIIEKHRPELAKQLVEGLEQTSDSFVEGFIAGSKESIKEKVKSRSRVISKLKSLAKKNIPNPTKGKDNKDKGYEIDI